MNPNIASLLWTAAAEHPAQPAIVERGSVIDYDALVRRAAATAAGLVQHGLKPHERVGIFLDGGAEAIGAFFGVAAVGGIAVIINESLRPRQVEHILEASSASALITTEDLLARQPRGRSKRGAGSCGRPSCRLPRALRRCHGWRWIRHRLSSPRVRRGCPKG